MPHRADLLQSSFSNRAHFNKNSEVDEYVTAHSLNPCINRSEDDFRTRDHRLRAKHFSTYNSSSILTIEEISLEQQSAERFFLYSNSIQQ